MKALATGEEFLAVLSNGKRQKCKDAKRPLSFYNGINPTIRINHTLIISKGFTS
jgi:hypothetical protein